MELANKSGAGRWVDATVGTTFLERKPAGMVTIVDITERKRAESKLRESEEHYRVAIESSNDAVAIVAGDIHAYTNRRFLETFGFDSAEEVIGKPMSMVVHPDDRDRIARINRMRQAGEPVPGRYEFRGIRKNGEPVDIEVSATRTFYGGKPVSLAYLRDITERTRTEKDLQSERLRFRMLIERAPFGMAVIGKDYTFEYINPQFRDLFGYGLEDIPDSRTWVAKAFPDDRRRRKATVSWATHRKAWSSGEALPPATFPVRCKDGTEKIINFRSLELETGGYLMTCEDITEVMKAGKALRESEEKYRNVIETSLVGVYIIQDDRFKFVNRKFCEIHGASYDEILSMTDVLFRVHDDDRAIVVDHIGKRLCGELQAVEYEFRIAVNGEIRTLKALGTTSSFQGRPAIYGTLLDISKEKILERQLTESQKLETVGRLAGGIAHDFNNVLNIILGDAQLAKRSVPDGHKAFEYCTSIEKAVFRAAEFVKQLLAFSRRQLLELKVVDLNDTVRKLTMMVGHVIGENIDIKVLTGPRSVPVKVDPGQIDQILLNLVVNARESITGDGQIIIETSERFLNPDYCRFNPDARPGSYAVVSITDTGCGMEQETVSRIFEPFFSNKGNGTGLGLSVVYGIVRQHNGFINVYSEVGEGTTFRIYLPSAKETAERDEPAPRETKEINSETVLVVEDEAQLREIAAEVLDAIGYKVITAADGEEAVTIFRDRYREIDIALIDVVMPRLGGRETYEAMKKIDPSLRALFMTGYSLNGIHTNFILEQGIDAIQKPYSFDDLAKKLREILDRQA